MNPDPHGTSYAPSHTHMCSYTYQWNITSTWACDHKLPLHTSTCTHDYVHTCTSKVLYLADEEDKHLNFILPWSLDDYVKFSFSLNKFCFVVLAIVYSIFFCHISPWCLYNLAWGLYLKMTGSPSVAVGNGIFAASLRPEWHTLPCFFLGVSSNPPPLKHSFCLSRCT